MSEGNLGQGTMFNQSNYIAMFKSLEDILADYFGCRGKAFLRNPKIINDDYYAYFTKSGAKAYNKLTQLIEDLYLLGVFDGLDITSEDIVVNLDEIVRNG